MRLDVYLTKEGICESRKKASDRIKNGNIFIDGKCIQKASYEISEDFSGTVEIEGDVCSYVGRGGLKLEAALTEFGIAPEGLVCADIGSSTGGFTDCLLQRNALRVYAVDSGKGQLHPKIRNDKRVICMEETNARFLTLGMIGEKCDLVVMDVSFISQTLLYGAVSNILKDGGLFISLIKPQFEAGRENIGKKGIVKDEKTRLAVCEKIKNEAKFFGLRNTKIITSPILGGDGNKEYLGLFEFKRTN